MKILPITGKPLKAPNDPPNPNRLPFHLDLLSSPKMDGNRGLCIGGRVFSSSMKAPRNLNVHQMLNPLIQLAAEEDLMFDYELYDPAAPHHAVTSGIINSIDKPLPDTLGCYIFDCMPTVDFESLCEDYPYEERYHFLKEMVANLNGPFFEVEQRPVHSPKDVMHFFYHDLREGFEGSIIRAGKIKIDPRGKRIGGFYKHGRATKGQGTIFKLKNFQTIDARIVAVIQGRKMKDHVPREINELGYLDQPGTKDSFKPDDIVGALQVVYYDEESLIQQECRIGFGKGFTDYDKRILWKNFIENPATLMGKHVEFSHMPHGSQRGGAARFGKLKRFRPDLDEEKGPF